MSHTTYCCICGGPPNTDGYINAAWLNKIGVIMPSNKYAYGTYDYYGEIKMGTYTISVDPLSNVENDRNGYLVHKDCHSLVSHIKDLYAKLLSFKRHRISGYLVGLSYVPLAKYAGQFFDFEWYKENPKDHYALKSPVYNKENRERVMKNIKKIDQKPIKAPKPPPDPRKMAKKGLYMSRKTGKYEKRKSKSASASRSRSRSRSRSHPSRSISGKRLRK